MTELIRDWVLGITAVSFLYAAANAFTDGKSGNKILKIINSIALLLAVILPLCDTNIDLNAEYMDFITVNDLSVSSNAAEELLCKTLEDELSVSIESKVKSLGFNYQIYVHCEYDDNCVVPTACYVEGEYDKRIYELINETGIGSITFDGG